MNAIRHYFDGLYGVRCRIHLQDVVIGLSWDTITCPDCLSRKKEYEPNTVEIDTRGD